MTLRRRMRAHAYFPETVPIVLIAMAASEQAGAPAWLLIAGGGLLVVDRALTVSNTRRPEPDGRS